MAEVKPLTTLDPKFNEYLFDLLQNIGPDRLKFLSSAELKIVSSRALLKNFVHCAALEKKLSLLTRVGEDWFLVFSGRKTYETVKIMNTVYRREFAETEDVKQIEAMMRNKTFVLAAKNVAVGMQIMAHHSHNDVYFINMDYRKISDAVTMHDFFSRREGKEMEENRHEADKATDIVSNFIFESNMIESFLNVFGIGLCELMIMLQLRARRRINNYTKIKTIQDGLKGKFKSTTVFTTANKMCMAGLIDKYPSQARSSPRYTLTASGVLVLNSVADRIIKSVLYNMSSSF